MPGWLGAVVAGGPKLTVLSVREGSPAHRAGLYAQDEIVAESGFRIDRAGLWERLLEQGPRGAVHLAVFRRDELLGVEVPLADPPLDTIWVESLPEATAEQRSLFESWVSAPLSSEDLPARGALGA